MMETDSLSCIYGDPDAGESFLAVDYRIEREKVILSLSDVKEKDGPTKALLAFQLKAVHLGICDDDRLHPDAYRTAFPKGRQAGAGRARPSPAGLPKVTKVVKEEGRTGPRPETDRRQQGAGRLVGFPPALLLAVYADPG
jgi:hypothetical protein